MGRRLYVGNLSYSTTEADLRDAFVATGHDVAEVKLVLDRDTGRPRGFAFVEMATDAAAAQAIETLNGREIQGRTVAVSEARQSMDGGGSGGHSIVGRGRIPSGGSSSIVGITASDHVAEPLDLYFESDVPPHQIALVIDVLSKAFGGKLTIATQRNPSSPDVESGSTSSVS
jgi:hypothetical protein